MAMFGKKPISSPQTSGAGKKTSPFVESCVTASIGSPAVVESASDGKTSLAVTSDAFASAETGEKVMVPDITPAPIRNAPQTMATISFTDPNLVTPDFIQAKETLVERLLENMDFAALERVSKDLRKARISESVDKLITDINSPLTAPQTALLKADLLNEVLGFGPLEVLLSDPDVSDIMINTSKQVYIEKKGKILLSDITFTGEKHLLNTIQKIVSLVGRRIDETSPMVDARMPDGSRFNAIIAPLALDGSLVSIRKFKKNKIPLSQYVDFGSMTPEMAKFLEICGNIRLNIIISGGTGSGKTTLLNALSGNIDLGERVITIEDAAELMLHQPHVLRLETRPANTEGSGEVTQRQLVRNALRMRPDRIILGEIRGDEVLDVLSAMNTGHDGSMATIHSNSPRDCLSRIENLLSMTGIQMPLLSLRQQIAGAVNLIVQVARLRDGVRRITHIEEVVGMNGDVITTQTLFGYQSGPMDANGYLTGKFYCAGIRPRFLSQAQYFNRDKEMIECLHTEHNR